MSLWPGINVIGVASGNLGPEISGCLLMTHQPYR